MDVAHLIKNEKKSPVGVFEEQETEFIHVEAVRQKGQSFFTISDSSGHITILLKNLRLKSRIEASATEPLLALSQDSNSLLMLQPNAIAFSALLDNKMSPFYCEGSFTNEYRFE